MACDPSSLSARAVLALLALAGALPAAQAASGSDLAYGYRWHDTDDGSVPETAYFDAGVTTLGPADNSAPVAATLPFAGGFPFYGGTYSTLWISDNGWMSFVDPAGQPHPAPGAIPNAAEPNGVLAPYWRDLVSDNPGFGFFINHGEVQAIGAYLIEQIAQEAGGGNIVGFRTYLFASGRIQFQYIFPGEDLALSTVGIENVAGDDGIRIASGGTQAAGVPQVVPNGYAIDFVPPAILSRVCASIPVVACPGTVNGTMPGTLGVNVTAYACTPAGQLAREQAYTFTIAQPSAVTISLAGGPNLGAFLLAACDETKCVRGPITNDTIPLAPGQYYVLVDAPAQADEGPFTLQLSCSALGPAINCGASVTDTTAGGSSFFPAYGCATPPDLSGPEDIHVMTVLAPTNVRAQLTGLTADLDILVLRLATGEIDGGDCVAWGDASTVAWNAQPGTYLLVVDGVAGASGGYTLATECRVDLQCGTLAGTVDFANGRIQNVAGDSASGSDRVEEYACSTTRLDGTEVVYRIDMPEPGQIVALQTGGTPGLSFFLLSDCNEGACAGGGVERGCGARLDAGTHYLVVDSPAGQEGPFEVMLAYEETFNRWSECELPAGTTLLTDTVSNFWNLNDQAFCITVQNSLNFPDGCVFAMYAVVQCGTEFHVPLYDTEGGHIRIFDVFQGQYVDLVAQSTGPWSQSGTEIQWQDADCIDGSDPRWNEQTVDVSFTRSSGLCGVYRLEFINHSGNVWELYANCTGLRSGQFNIHDSLCGALGEFAPLPNLSLVAASAIAACPDVSITYEVRNDGCGLARDVPVELWANGMLVATDVLPEAPFGEVTTRTFSATYPFNPATGVQLRLDPNDVVLECSEPAASGSSCSSTGGLDELGLPDCSGVCDVTAGAVITPPGVCAGDALTVDARGSSASDCGGALEYQLSDGTGVIAPWQASSVFTGLTPAQATTYTVEVRCSTSTACADSTTVSADVERPPDFDPASVIATDISDCAIGIRLTWSAATFHGTAGFGTYSVYRSTTSCADAIASPLNRVGSGIFGTSFDDTSTADATTYFYVVEAEDGTPATLCTLRGPTNSGTVTRVDASGGTCTGVTEVATGDVPGLPRVGASLRLGGTLIGIGRRYSQTFVDLTYSTDRPIDPVAGEHFHLYKSERPDGGFAMALVEPPRLTAPSYRDANAADTVGDTGLHVWHYLMSVSDGCESDNLDLDNP